MVSPCMAIWLTGTTAHIRRKETETRSSVLHQAQDTLQHVWISEKVLCIIFARLIVYLSRRTYLRLCLWSWVCIWNKWWTVCWTFYWALCRIWTKCRTLCRTKCRTKCWTNAGTNRRSPWANGRANVLIFFWFFHVWYSTVDHQCKIAKYLHIKDVLRPFLSH